MVNLYHPERIINVYREIWVNGMKFYVRIEFCRQPDGKFGHYYTDTEWGEDIDGSPLCDKEEISELECWSESYYKEINGYIFDNMGDIVEEALELEAS